MMTYKGCTTGPIDFDPDEGVLSGSFAGQLGGKVSSDPVQERYMGGGFCAIGYSREAPASAGLFRGKP